MTTSTVSTQEKFCSFRQ